MAIPTGDVGRIEAFHRFDFDDEVLEDFVERVAEVDVAVGVGRAVVQHVQGAGGADFGVEIFGVPAGKGARLHLGEVGLHGEGGFGQVDSLVDVHAGGVQQNIFIVLDESFPARRRLHSFRIAQEGDQEFLRKGVIADLMPTVECFLNKLNLRQHFCARPVLRIVVIGHVALLLHLKECVRYFLKVCHAIEIRSLCGWRLGGEVIFAHAPLPVAGVLHLSVFEEPRKDGPLFGPPPV